MKCRSFVLFVLLLLLAVPAAPAEDLQPLPMNSTAIAPAPSDEGFLSDREYRDDSISVVISEGEYLDVHYWSTRVKISHPSQLRTVPAMQVSDPHAVFSPWYTGGAECARIARAANAVVAVNGDYVSNIAQCNVVLRQGQQIRNSGHGLYDVLIVKTDGDFDSIPDCTLQDYLAYYDAHPGGIYQAFCFGPVLVRDDSVVLAENFKNGYMISQNKTQRMAIAQVGPLDYLLITCDGDAQFNRTGLTIHEFADLCLTLGREISPDGLKLAYNLDGGNSASLVFKVRDENGKLVYRKLNMPERDRDLSDMICFVSLVK